METNLHRLAFKLVKGEVMNFGLFVGKEQMKCVLVAYDIWCRSLCASHKYIPIQGVKEPFHMLSTKVFKKVWNLDDKDI